MRREEKKYDNEKSNESNKFFNRNNIKILTIKLKKNSDK